jgi:hypothetical protein
MRFVWISEQASIIAIKWPSGFCNGEEMCLLGGLNWICKFNSGKFYLHTAVPWLRRLVAGHSLNPCEIYGEQVTLLQFVPSTAV